MPDIAEIGFKADTSDLSAAVSTLNTLSPAAGRAEKASSQLMKSISSLDASAAALAQGMTALNANVERLVSGYGKESRAATNAATAETRKASATNAAATASKAAADAANAESVALAKQYAALNRINSITGVSNVRKSASDSASVFAGGGQNQNGNRPSNFNTANIAAQFQDVGVTAAMGMNPLQIALQQGTQLSAVLQTMENPLKGIAAAFKQIINPVSLLTIGFIALLAAGLQMVNWTLVAKAALNGLASAVESVGPYVLGLAVTLGLLYATEILTGLALLVQGIYAVGVSALKAGAQMAAAWLIGMGPIGWIIIGIATVVAAMNIFRDELKKVFGTDIVEAAKDAVNKIIGFFVGAWNVIIQGWRNVQRELKGEARIPLMDVFKEALEKDYIGKLADGVAGAMSGASDKLRKLADGMGDGTGKKKGKSDAEKFDDIVNGAERTIASLQAEKDAVGLSEEAHARLKYQTDLLNDAKQKNIELSAAQKMQLYGLADSMAILEAETKRNKEAMDFAKSATKGFFSDLKSGLEEGKGLWRSFADAVLNVIDKIQDRLLDMAVDNLFDSFGGGGSKGISGGSGSGASGLFEGIFNSIFGGATKHAKGDAFTNGIYTKPTLFRYAKGDSFGEMGEAGPEAVMPLRRGPDGSLGVQMYQDKGGAPQQQESKKYFTFNIGGDVSQKQFMELQKYVAAAAGPGVVEQRVAQAQVRGQL